MELGPYLLNGILEGTTPPNETAAAARDRRDAIMQMVLAYDPTDAAEGMIVCHCIMLHFVERGAMRDANNTSLEPKALSRNRAQALSVTRTLLQWVTKLENMKKRRQIRENAARAAAAEARTAAAPAPEPNPRPPVTPPLQPRPIPPDRPANQAPAAPSGVTPRASTEGARAGPMPAVPAGAQAVTT